MKIPIHIKAAIIMVLLVVAGQANTGGEPPSLPVERSWRSGAITATLSSNGTFGTLRISGEGAMDDYGLESDDKDQYPSWVFAGYFNSVPITTLVIEEGVTRIGYSAFAKKFFLTSVTIPSTVTSIGKWAFKNCQDLTSVIIPNGVTDIEAYAFEGSGLTSVIIPDGVESIGREAFRDCKNLTSVTISGHGTSIGYGAFNSCTSLTSVTILGDGVSIGNAAFLRCSNLKLVTMHSLVPPELGDCAFCDISSPITVSYPKRSSKVYHSADGWKELFLPKRTIWTPVTALTAIIILGLAGFVIIKRSRTSSKSNSG